MTAFCTVTTPVGILQISGKGKQLSCVEILSTRQVAQQANHPDPDFCHKLEQAFSRYFQDPCYQFDFEFELHGTDFQKRVWQALLAIPAGEVRTYGQIADQLNSSPRAVGNACRANQVAIIIPCHRVVSQSGLGGYAGKTAGEKLAIKNWLLNHEGVEIAA